MQTDTRGFIVHLWAYCNLPIAHDMNDTWCLKGRPHSVGSFTSSSIWLMREGWRREGQQLNVIAQWRGHLKSQPAWSHQIFQIPWGPFSKAFTLVIYKCSHCFRVWEQNCACKRFIKLTPGCWSGQSLNPQPCDRQNVVLTTELSGQRLTPQAKVME